MVWFILCRNALSIVTATNGTKGMESDGIKIRGAKEKTIRIVPH